MSSLLYKIYIYKPLEYITIRIIMCDAGPRIANLIAIN